MKHFSIKLITLVIAILFLVPSFVIGQDEEDPHIVYVTKLKMAFPEDGSNAEYDSLNALFMENVVNKNKYILSQYRVFHYITPSVKDYLIISEYENLEAWEKSGDENTRLAKEWIEDDEKRSEFFDARNKYFENWHGDYIYTLDEKK
jgi:hypothetical protein